MRASDEHVTLARMDAAREPAAPADQPDEDYTVAFHGGLVRWLPDAAKCHPSRSPILLAETSILDLGLDCLSCAQRRYGRESSLQALRFRDVIRTSMTSPYENVTFGLGGGRFRCECACADGASGSPLDGGIAGDRLLCGACLGAGHGVETTFGGQPLAAATPMDPAVRYEELLGAPDPATGYRVTSSDPIVRWLPDAASCHPSRSTIVFVPDRNDDRRLDCLSCAQRAFSEVPALRELRFRDLVRVSLEGREDTATFGVGAAGFRCECACGDGVAGSPEDGGIAGDRLLCGACLRAGHGIETTFGGAPLTADGVSEPES